MQTWQSQFVGHLAAAVIRGIVEWQHFQQRMQGEQQRREFLKESKNTEITGNRMVGVPDDLSYFVTRLGAGKQPKS